MQEFSVLRDPNVRRCAAVGRARQVPGHVLSGDPRVEAEALPDLYVKHEPKKPKQSTAGGEQATSSTNSRLFWHMKRTDLTGQELWMGTDDGKVQQWQYGSLFNDLQCITDETTSL